MSRIYRLPVRVCALALVLCAACGRGEPGPTAPAAQVVDAAPDATLAAREANVESSGPYVSATGTVDFATGADELTIAGRDTKSVPWGVVQPVATLDLLRGVVDVRSYGGAQVQGIGTKRYNADVDIEKAIEATPQARRDDLRLLLGEVGDDGQLWLDVFIASDGRVRRILLPVELA
ncbi:MAG: hypothetical protein Q8K63_10720, partial [Acidimicrobiales bacterium]|nr:hypothetical protein [Acidimicrobiales bacterium]